MFCLQQQVRVTPQCSIKAKIYCSFNYFHHFRLQDVGDLTSKHGKLTATSSQFTDTDIQLIGATTIFGRTLLLRSSAHSACATINGDGSVEVRTAVARFPANVAGTVQFRQIKGKQM